MFFAHCLDSMRHYDATIQFGIAPGTASMMCRKNTVIRNHQALLNSSITELKIYSSNLISKIIGIRREISKVLVGFYEMFRYVRLPFSQHIF